MYRINRDVRFSADKSPYKTWFGALLGKQGRKSETLWTYFQVGAEGQFAGGGRRVQAIARAGQIHPRYNRRGLQPPT
ncbi:MAG: DUF2461 family protein [Chloroflexi bacterium]|nr:DUF2461 family protein [Chloroflexota bacterium]